MIVTRTLRGMAARSWAGSSITAVAIAAGAGAAQLGIGYGLGIVAWLPAVEPDNGRVPWLASLAWVVWIAATSTVLGAVTAHMLAGRGDSHPDSLDGFVLGAWRAALVFAAAIGALVVVPLVAVPARAAETPDNFAPEWTAAGYVVLGVIIGLLTAVGALTARAVAANVVATAAYIWLLAVISVTDNLRQGDEPVLAQLAFWEFNGGPQVRGFYMPGVVVMLVAAAAIGFLAAWRAGRRGDSRVGVAISGAVGPLLVAAAYLLAAPQFAGEDNVDISQWSAAMFAPYAVIAGLAGSVLVAAIGPPLTAQEKAERRALAAERQATREAERQAAAQARAAEKQAAAERRAADKQAAAEAKAQEKAQGKTAQEDRETPVPVLSKASDQRSDDDLVGWPAALEDKPTARVATSSGTQPVRDPDDDLADDDYAPSRAYRSLGRSSDTDAKAYATDTVEPEPTANDKPAEDKPRPGPKPPLWPGRTAQQPTADDSDGGGTDPDGPRPRTRRPKR
ncbi:hypothetical protein Voc01_012490 [Virgisporangium ochraceum]|uniref:Uncharacterized protein n=2 Tax=Virgisporangium ochraceum TaxID=65505 RepID=A0A8J3ZLL8_9ACTN|nr:hypothetical protein Voc01_012490 [Virgisporangium ochraceum]